MRKMAMAAMAAWAAMAWALAPLASGQELDRQFPTAAAYCESTSNSLPTPSAWIQTLAGASQRQLSPALVIRDRSMRTIVSGLLPQAWKGMCMFGIDGSLEKIWLLSEWQAAKQAAKAQAAAAAAAAQ